MKKLWAIVLVAAVLLAGCGAESANGSYDTYNKNYAVATTSAAMEMDREEVSAGGSVAGSTSTPDQTDSARKWIITVSIRTETEDMDATLGTVEEKVAAVGGYVENQEVQNGSAYGNSKRYRQTNMTVRIPADKLDEFMAEVKGNTNVTSSTVNKSDITLQYVATESRIKALETEEARLLELMKEAGSLTELLEVERRLTDVRYEREYMTSQLRVMDNQVDYATVWLYISEVQEYSPQEDASFWEKISEGFSSNVKALGSFMSSFVVWFISSLPTLLFLGALASLVVWICRKVVQKSRIRRETKWRQMQERQAGITPDMTKPENPQQ